MPSGIATNPRQMLQSVRALGSRSSAAILLIGCVVATACGDGIGRPIRAVSASAGSASMAGDSGGGAGSPIDAAIDYCSPTLDWPAEQVAAEDELLAILNLVRQSGYRCSVGSPRIPASSLSMLWPLRCSARLHSMASFLGESAANRVVDAGYSANRIAEVTTTSEPTNVGVEFLLVKLLTSAGTDCANLLDPLFPSVGIGFVAGSAQGYWTIDLASP